MPFGPTVAPANTILVMKDSDLLAEREGPRSRIRVNMHLSLSIILSKVSAASLRRYISISIPGTCVNHIINPHQVFPTTQKKEVLPWCWGWLGLVISFG